MDDENDNLPLLLSNDLILCERSGELGSVVMVAEDKDSHPYSSPFLFELMEPHEGEWKLSKLNGKVCDGDTNSYDHGHNHHS